MPSDLERLAAARGCDYYERAQTPGRPLPAKIPLSNAELAIALIAPSRKPSAREIRLAAALLGTPELRPEEIASLARQENCPKIVKHIAEAGHRFEPENAFWSRLLGLLPEVTVDSDKLPHPTRFVEMTGIARGRIGLETRWIRPREPLAA